MTRAVRIEPRMQLQTARMRFAHGKSERIVKRLGCTALLTREILRPWLERRLVERVASRTDMQNESIETELARSIEQTNQLDLLRIYGQARPRWPVDIGDCGNPDATELADYRRRSIRGRRGRNQRRRGSAAGQPRESKGPHHSGRGHDVIDSCEESWGLYAAICRSFGPVSGLSESLLKIEAPGTRRKSLKNTIGSVATVFIK